MKRLFTYFFLLLSLNGYCTHYYVSASGSDANSGLIGFPWKTIAKVNSVAFVAGDIISFNGGDVFYGAIIVNNSGSAGNPITYNSYGTGKATTTGFTTISAWSNLGSNIWESTSAISTLSTCNMVTIGGTNVRMGRTPNSGYYTYQSAVTNTTITNTTGSINSSTTNWTGAELVIRKYNYVTDRAPITNHTGSIPSTITYSSPDSYNGQAGYGFYIQNDARTLDAQNEWYYNPSTKKIRIYSTSSPVNVQVSTKDTLVTIIGLRAYVTFDNLTFTGANKFAFTIRSAQNITIQNCTFDYNHDGIWGGQNGGANSTTFIFQNNTLNHTNNQAITLETEFVGAYIGHNSISNTGTVDGMGGTGAGNNGTLQGVYLYAASSIFEYNTVHNTGFNGITFAKNGVQVRYNFIDSFCTQKFDGGGIYAYVGVGGGATTYTGQKVYNNITLDGVYPVAGTPNTGNKLVNGIYMDGGTSNVEIYNNTSAGNPQAGILINNADTNQNVHDNTFYNNGQYQIFVVSNDGTYPIKSLTLKNNIAFSKTSTQLASSWNTRYNDIATFGSAASIDSNYYARPIDDNLTMETFVLFTTNTQRTLAGWKTYSGFDAHSAKSPLTISDVNDLRFEYNATSSPVTRSLPFKYIDVRSVVYDGTITLQPYSSAVLIKNGAVSNILPSSNAGSDQSITLPVNSLTLSGSGFDVDGTISSYQWTNISGFGTIVSPTSATSNLTGLVTAGSYLYSLRVTDNLGGINIDTMQVTVNPAANIPPSSNAGSDQSTTALSVTLTGSGTDTDGTISSYAWTKLSGTGGTITTPASASTSVTGLSVGVYVFQLAVTDNNSATTNDSIQVTILSSSTIIRDFQIKRSMIYR